jgi:hypothetical protein
VILCLKINNLAFLAQVEDLKVFKAGALCRDHFLWSTRTDTIVGEMG